MFMEYDSFLRILQNKENISALFDAPQAFTRRHAVCFPSGCAVLRGSHSLPLSTAL